MSSRTSCETCMPPPRARKSDREADVVVHYRTAPPGQTGAAHVCYNAGGRRHSQCAPPTFQLELDAPSATTSLHKDSKRLTAGPRDLR